LLAAACRRLARVGVAAAVAALAACATADVAHLMSTPVVFKDERLDFSRAVPPERRTTEVPVFYATTRAPVEAGAPGHYGNEPGEGVRLGIARVALGEPGWTFEQLLASDKTSTVDRPRPGRVERVDEIGTVRTGEARSAAERALVERIDAHLATLANKEIVLYVHGYRVTFDDVAVLMGSLSHYLGHGTMVAFQWPTGQHFWNYLSDCPNAEKYVPDIARLVELLGHTRAEYINVIAYSCGSPLLAEALKQLRARFPDEDRARLTRRYRLGSVIFVASDIDLKTFARDHVPAIMDLAQQTSVYVSRRDAALGFSTAVAGVSRLGRPDIADLKVRDIEQLAADPRLHGIDVTDVRGAHEVGGMAGHGYWYANEWIATDVVLALRYPTIAPGQRCLVPVAPGRRIWRIPDDYPDCVAGRLLKAHPELRRAPP
jgi:esterase/lipase superfamily enzyme